MVGDAIAAPVKIALITAFHWLLDEDKVEISQYRSIQEMLYKDAVAEYNVEHKVEYDTNDSTGPMLSAATSLFDVINE